MDLFRKSALQRMASPEHLDELIHITQPRDWLALITLFGILIAIILWSILGQVSIEMPGDGIILRAGGIRTLFATTSGIVAGIDNYHRGELIKSGQLIATIKNPLLNSRIQAQKTLLENLTGIQKKFSRNQNLSLDSQIAEVSSQLQLLHDEISISQIKSDYSGFITQIKTKDGDYVSPGTPLLSIENEKRNLYAEIYVSASVNINLIRPGMQVKIFPGLEKKANLGYLQGTVLHVTKFPITTDEMMSVLHNPDLVKLFFAEGPRYGIVVELIPDVSTASGYKWSSSAGKNISITSGALCTAMITLSRQKPISLLFPV